MDFNKFAKHLSENDLIFCGELIKENKGLEPTNIDQSRILAEFYIKIQEFQKAYSILQVFKNHFDFKARYLCFVISCQLRDKDLSNKPLAIVVGSEGKGISRLVAENCDLHVSIPITSKAESLNASVAASIVLYQIAVNRAIAKQV